MKSLDNMTGPATCPHSDEEAERVNGIWSEFKRAMKDM
jgi:hypothetical protein